jgi:alkanesulfonate monooxygenase SsuD/methylene tetrahydromethanopterin reductase-like flavin-dependent oxidoreductase (luciferase family)
MTTIGYHASHEQFSPSHLLHLTRAAEAAGFDAAMCSDHFHPWTEQQGQRVLPQVRESLAVVA